MSSVYINLPVPGWWTRFETQFNRFDPKSDAIWINYAKDLAGLKRFMTQYQLDKMDVWQENHIMASRLTELLVCVPVVIKSGAYDLHLIHGVEGDGSYAGSKFYVRRPLSGSGSARLWKTIKLPLSDYNSAKIQYMMYNEKEYKKCIENQRKFVA